MDVPAAATCASELAQERLWSKIVETVAVTSSSAAFSSSLRAEMDDRSSAILFTAAVFEDEMLEIDSIAVSIRVDGVHRLDRRS